MSFWPREKCKPRTCLIREPQGLQNHPTLCHCPHPVVLTSGNLRTIIMVHGLHVALLTTEPWELGEVTSHHSSLHFE